MMLPIPFDNPTTYKGHSGVDYGVPIGTPIPASDSGTVEWLGWNQRGGYFIWVRYDSIKPRVGYHHMDSHEHCPTVGSRVSVGDILGLSGNSGRSTGPHLHSEVEGYATTNGYWKFFTPDRVVGESASGSNVSKKTEIEDEEMTASYINVQGKAGSHEAGTFAIMRSNKGALFARRVTRGTITHGFPIIDNRELESWQETMNFVGL